LRPEGEGRGFTPPIVEDQNEREDDEANPKPERQKTRPGVFKLSHGKRG
jgi:hypothetical protein